MGWKQWSAVAVVIGGGILLQIPGHDEVGMDRGEMLVMAEPQGPYTTVALDVMGLT